MLLQQDLVQLESGGGLLSGNALKHATKSKTEEIKATRRELDLYSKGEMCIKYEDPEFPSDARSLFRDPDRPWYGHVPVETLGPWRRPADIGNTPDLGAFPDNP